MAFLDKIVGAVDAVSTLPGDIQRRADKLNDRVINFARKIQGAADDAADRVEGNLAQNKIRGLGGNAADWISKPRNLAISAVAAIVVIILIRKL